MAVVKFYKSSVAGKAETMSKTAGNEGVVCFDLASGEIWLGGVLVGEANDSITRVTNVAIAGESEGEKAGKLKVTYDSGNPTYIDLPKGVVYTAGDGIDISDDNEISVDWSLGENAIATQQTGAVAKDTTFKSTDDIRDILLQIIQKEYQPTITANPAVTVTLSNSGAYEVGTSVTPSYSAKLSAGSYTYGPATGITASSWEVHDSESETSTSDSGTMPAITVEDSTNYAITATATYAAGTQAVTNLGNISNPVVQIAAGSATANSSKITGFRSYFYGTKVTPLADSEIDSAAIRALTNSAKAVGSQFSVTIPEGTMQVILAAPATYTKLSVLDVNNSNMEIAGTGFKTKLTVDVEGANGFSAESYNVWIANPSTSLKANTYKVTFSK